MLGRPEVIFADEPTGNLDSAASEQVLELLRTAVRDFGQTTVMVTHDQIAASFADHVITMADGRVAA
jgi:putative ABC transport system ATP-binding protein